VLERQKRFSNTFRDLRSAPLLQLTRYCSVQLGLTAAANGLKARDSHGSGSTETVPVLPHTTLLMHRIISAIQVDSYTRDGLSGHRDSRLRQGSGSNIQ